MAGFPGRRTPHRSDVPQPHAHADETLAHDGVKQLRLRAGAAGKAAIALQAKGPNLGLAPTGVLPLAQDPRVIVQLTNDAGQCWSADYAAPARVNRPDAFLDRGE